MGGGSGGGCRALILRVGETCRVTSGVLAVLDCLWLIPMHQDACQSGRHLIGVSGAVQIPRVSVLPAFPAHLFIKVVDRNVEKVDICFREMTRRFCARIQTTMPVLEPVGFHFVFGIGFHVALILLDE